MEKSSIIINSIMFLVIAIPLAFLVIYTTQGEKRVKKKVIKLCRASGVNLSVFDITGNVVLGLDSVSKKLVVSNRKQLENDFQIIDLPTLKDCRVKTVKLTSKTTDWVGLELVGTDYNKEVAFYAEDDEDNPSTDSQICIQQALKWEKIIKPLLKAS
ncbi:hypothetical protein ATE92_1001 [Ulvibacter sp. MAR_2010_11]|uniref:hypothetical protein n=1 Tax=Ulvibacter sp. MAR_2010_11 TaxID=1250229 RepID=UPI000C2CE134|nr:hypothetical protein [Ulvibacter sp. MAR_2010_11]PKA82861.1 hypothetical protein ATE92_1001 [Ulvibacter sp. MAR_2010_11]